MELLKLFCSIMPSSLKSKRTNRLFKPTIKDSQRSFVICAENPHEALIEVNNLQEMCLHNKVKLQPNILSIGRKYDAVEFYVLLDSFKYHCGSFLEALDLNFKIFHVFGLHYPIYCQNLWLFIQKYLYNISTDYDEKIPIVSTIISDLNHIDFN